MAGHPASAVRGWPVWGRPLGLLALILLGPLLLLPTPLASLALTWAFLLLLAIWALATAGFIGALVGTETPVLPRVEGALRAWVARFAPDPSALWVHWARETHRPVQARDFLQRAAACGGAEGLFQEGLAWFGGGFGSGGDAAGRERMARAARRGHPEAAFWLAEALRTGRGGPRDGAGALVWYQRSASAGFGPAAAWLAEAHERGDGAPADPEQARRWAEAAVRLAPHPVLSRSPLRHDAAPEDPLVRAGAGVARRLVAAADRVVAHRMGQRLVVAGAVLLAGSGLALVATFFLVGASGLFFLPLLMLVPPLLLLVWQAWRLRQEGPRRGRDRLRDAAEAGDPQACFRMGLACRQGGPHRPKDDLEAARWFHRAAEAGHRGAMEALALAYLGGHGVLRDPREAARWAEAARRGP